MIKEITKLQNDIYITIDIKEKKLKLSNIKRIENTIPFGSKESLKIIDKWVDKWGYIIRSLKKKTDNISADLSGGFDTRTVLSILLNSNINLNEILMKSINDNISCHEEDFKIANNISSKYGFKLNKFSIYKNSIKFDLNDSLYLNYYTKL